MENGELRGREGVLHSQFSILHFDVDVSNKTAMFEVAWTNTLFDYTDSRNLHLFSSTNLLGPRWTPLGAFLMPSGTNSCTFTVTTNART